MEAGDKLVLLDMEGNKHAVDKRIVGMSAYLKGIRDNGSIQNNTVTLDSVKGVCIDRIIEFCRKGGRGLLGRYVPPG